jgi:AIG2-like family
MLHFAYGSNMDRAIMRRHAPSAEPIGVAWLSNRRFVITADGYASVEPAQAQTVHGVLWRLTPRDRVTLDMWENTASGMYCAKSLPVRRPGWRRPVLVYVARRRRAGRPKAGYMELVLSAARAWDLPSDYIASLQAWLPAQPLGAGPRNLKEFGWM